MKGYPYILSVYCCGLSALHLRDYINDHLPEDARWIRYKKELQAWPPMIRWGNSDPSDFNEDNVINNGEHVETCANKLKLAKLLDNHHIPVVTFHKDEPKEYPVVIRTILHGQAGQGIIFAKNKDEWLPYKGHWWSKYIKFQFELRVHTLEGVAVKIAKKVLEHDDDKEIEFPIRNADNGYHFAKKKLDLYPKAIELAKQIHEFFPIAMVGWDMGYCLKDHKYYIIEGNSAPSLNPMTLPLYGNYLLKKLWNIDVVEGGDNA